MLVQSFLITIYNKKIILVPNPSTLSTNELVHKDLEENSSKWCCSQCTFFNNNSNEKCDMCSFQRNSSS
jgi:hypothetical protein